jgi:hypothetical protein
MKSAFTRSAAAVFTLVAALFFLAVPSAKATPTGPAPYGTFTFFGTGTVANNSFSWTSGSDLALAGPNPVGSGGVVTFTAATTLQPLSSPADLFTLVVNSDTLTFFLTEVDSYTSAGVGTKGSFTGIGYFTDLSWNPLRRLDQPDQLADGRRRSAVLRLAGHRHP